MVPAGVFVLWYIATDGSRICRHFALSDRFSLSTVRPRRTPVSSGLVRSIAGIGARLPEGDGYPDPANPEGDAAGFIKRTTIVEEGQ